MTCEDRNGDTDNIESDDYTDRQIRKYIQNINHCQEKFEETGNPIYVWAAIQAACLITTFESMRDRVLRVEERLTDAELCPSELPLWIMCYLRTTAFAVMDRAYRVYHRKPSSEPFTNEPLPTLTSDEIIARIPSDFGFVRNGWNAFTQFRRTWEAGDTAARFDTARRQGLGSRDAKEKVMDEMGIVEERTLTRRLAAAKRRRIVRKMTEVKSDKT